MYLPGMASLLAQTSLVITLLPAHCFMQVKIPGINRRRRLLATAPSSNAIWKEFSYGERTIDKCCLACC